MKLSKIKKNPDNPRVIKDERFEKLVKSIREFPKMMKLRPMVVDKNYMVLGGNQRLTALMALGYDEIPDDWVKRADELTEEEKQRFIIADNVNFGDWDLKALGEDWDPLDLDAWGFEGELKEVKDIEVKDDGFEEPDIDTIITDIKEGDLFQIGPHKLLCGDATDPGAYGKLLNREQIDLMVTDPPYNVDYKGGTGLKIINDKQKDDAFYRFLFDFYVPAQDSLKPGGAFYIFHADTEGINFRTACRDSGLMIKSCLVWVKNSLVMGRADYHWKHEPILYGWKPGAAHYFTPDRTKTTVIDDKVDLTKLKKDEMLKLLQDIFSEKTKTSVIYHDRPTKSAEHPTMKPVLLVAELINNSSKKKARVGDYFAGSGSTMVACHQMERTCYSMDLDPRYCQVILERMTKLDPEISILKNGRPYKVKKRPKPGTQKGPKAAKKA